MIAFLEKSFIFCFFAQQSATGGTESKAPASNGITDILFGSPIGFMALSLAMLYLMVLLPQQRNLKNQQRELAELLKNLKKNDRVVTSSGIHGVVLTASLDVPTVTIRIDDATNAKMTVNREVITTVFKEEAKTNP